MKPFIEIPEYPHALLSPSKAAMWLACHGAVGMAKGRPSKPTSRYAAEGTAYHDVARRALTEDKDCEAYIGDRYKIGAHEFTIDADNCEQAQKYVDAVRAIPGKRMVEVDLEYSALLGVPQFYEHRELQGGDKDSILRMIPLAAGTGDCVILDYENKIVWGFDLKFGRGDIVYASQIKPGTETREINPQGGLYLAAAVARYELLGIEDDWKAIFGISQPRANHYDTHTMTVGELKAWVEAQKFAANRAYVLWTWGPERIDPALDLNPGEKQCRWCPLSGNCSAQTNKVLNQFPKGHAEQAIPLLTQIADEDIAEHLDRADEVEHWVSAVRAEGLTRALQGRVLPNWKLVQGRRGNRTLPEDLNATALRVPREVALTELQMEEVEDEFVELPIKDALHFAAGDAIYKPRDVKTAAQLEKVLVKKSPLLWAALQAHITQAPGAKHLARIEDPRAPLPIISTEFPIAPTGGKESLL